MSDSASSPQPWVDPLLAKDKKERRRNLLIGFLLAILLYSLIFVLLYAIEVTIKVGRSKKDNLVEIAIQEVPPPEPEVKPEPEPEPEPEEVEDEKVAKAEEDSPEPEPEPPKPQPKPKPRPKPKPEPKPKKEPEPKPEPAQQKAPDDAPKNAKEAMNPVNLEGLDKSQFADKGDGPAFKEGTGITTGKMNKEYVDPSRFGKIITKEGGTGLGYSDHDSDGTPAPPVAGKKCPTRAARIIKKFRGKYTAAAKRRGIEGQVIGLLTVSKTGKVVAVQIVKSLGSGLDESATAAFWQFVFEPAEKNCEPIASKVRISHNFTIER